MNKIGKPGQAGNELTSLLIIFCRQPFVIDNMQTMYRKVL